MQLVIESIILIIYRYTCDSEWKKITEVQRDGTNVFAGPAKGNRKTD